MRGTWTLARGVEWGCFIVVAFLVLYPLFWLFLGVFQSDPRSLTVTFKTLANVLSAYYIGEIVYNTAVMSVGTTILAVLLGVPLAWVVERTDVPLKELINLVALIPFITPPIVGAITWSYLGTPEAGFINVFWRWLTGSQSPLFDIFTLGGLVWVMALYLTPYVYIFTSIALRNMDPTHENAAYISGANPIIGTLRVTIPLAAPAILSGALLVFIQSLEIFAIPAAIGVPGGIYVFTTQMWRMILGVPPRFADAAVLSIPLLLIAALALWLQVKALGKGKQYTTVGGKGFRPRLISLQRWRYAALLFAFFYLLMSAILPYLTIIYGTFIKTRGAIPIWDNLTFRYVTEMFTGAASPIVVRAIKNSLVLSVGGATLGVILSMLVAYFLQRSRSKIRHALDFLSLIPVAIPGAVIAIGLLWAYIRPPFELYGTLTIMLLAYLTRFLPFGVRAVGSSVVQVSEELERAAYISGASWGTAFRTVLLPLVVPGIAAGWTIMFVSMMRELSASIMLYGFNKETLAVALFLIWDEGYFQYVSILSLIIVALSIIAVAFVRGVLRFAEIEGISS